MQNGWSAHILADNGEGRPPTSLNAALPATDIEIHDILARRRTERNRELRLFCYGPVRACRIYLRHADHAAPTWRPVVQHRIARSRRERVGRVRPWRWATGARRDYRIGPKQNGAAMPSRFHCPSEPYFNALSGKATYACGRPAASLSKSWRKPGRQCVRATSQDPSCR